MAADINTKGNAPECELGQERLASSSQLATQNVNILVWRLLAAGPWLYYYSLIASRPQLLLLGPASSSAVPDCCENPSLDTHHRP